jgi:hypothetical protein
MANGSASIAIIIKSFFIVLIVFNYMVTKIWFEITG